MKIRGSAAVLIGGLSILLAGAGVAVGQPAAAQATATAAATAAAQAAVVAPDPAVQTPEALVTEIYRRICIAPGSTKDWETVRSLFLPDAVVFLRVTRDSSAVFTVEEFVDDFTEFSKRPDVQEKGFAEKILWLKPFVFRNIAHVLVSYEAAITGSARPPQRGLDSFQLVRKEGRWWIAGITNEIPDPDNPLPAGPRE